METTLAKVRAALNRAAVTGYGHMPIELERELMHQHIIIEQRPGDWRMATAVVIGECVVMFLLGYLSRPVIQAWIGG